MADHLDPLRLAAGQRAGAALQAEVAEPDLHQGVEGLLQRGHQRRDLGGGQAADELRQVADLHGAGVRDADPVDRGGPGRLAQPGAAAGRARPVGDRAVDEGGDVRLHRVPVLGQDALLHLGDQALVGEVDALGLDLHRLVVEEVLPLLLGEVADLDVAGDQARLGVDPHVPPVRGVAGHPDRALVEGLAVVDQLVDVDVGDPAQALAGRAHALGRVEAEVEGRADVGLAEPAEDDPQHRVHVGRRAEGGAGVGAHPLLVDDDRRAEVLQRVDVRAAEAGHEPLDEGGVGLVDQPLRLGGDGAEDQGGLARPGDAGEDGQPPLRDLQRDAAQVVLPGSHHPDDVVAVGNGEGLIHVGERIGRGRHWGRPQVIPS